MVPSFKGTTFRFAYIREGGKGEPVGFPLFVLLALALLGAFLNVAKLAFLSKISRFL